jgi:hydroxylamine reductase
MSMFCYQCQEAANGKGCTVRGVCGKKDEAANFQDLLIYALKGVAILALEARGKEKDVPAANKIIMDGLFMTITNANFDQEAIKIKINEALEIRETLKREIGGFSSDHDAVVWKVDTDWFESKALEVGILKTENEDVRSLRELLTYGLKGIAAYLHHANILDFNNDEIHAFIQKALVSTLNDELSADDLVALILECGQFGVSVMVLLDQANTTQYGHPITTKVNIGVGNNPGILISGHDLKDLEELLIQTQGTGVDVYSHSEMLPGHYYPAFQKYDNFVGNYGNAWWKQKEEFESFNGPILMTTNCIVPPKDSYKDRVFTTGVAGFDGVKHIADRPKGGQKDFSLIIELAQKCEPPIEIETGSILGGFAHNNITGISDLVVDSVKSGHIKKFVVMAGCDGRMKDRNYYTDFAKALPQDAVILTAGCAKYRYNKLDLGEVNGIPRVLDAGQCNDSYSLVVVALKLKEAFKLEDINDLPIVYNIAWYEQKAVIVLLALLYLGVKNIKLGPTLPAFVSPNVAKVLIATFGISGVSAVEQDLKKMMD